MIITKITVRSATKFNHPTQSYSNLEAGIEITAEVAEWEDWWKCTKELQIHADSAVAAHKQQQIDTIRGAERLLQGAKRNEDDSEELF